MSDGSHRSVETSPARRARPVVPDAKVYALADEAVWVREASGLSPWGRGGVIAAIRKAATVWASPADLYRALFAAAADPEFFSPALIAQPGAFDPKPSAASIDAAKRRALTYDMPCPDHPDVYGKCPQCSAIEPAPRPSDWRRLVDESRRRRSQAGPREWFGHWADNQPPAPART